MKSGNPDPINELQLVILEKRNRPSITVDVVSEASRWLKSALKGADVEFQYASCEEREHYGFSTFQLRRSQGGVPVTLDLKVAEIRGTPYVFAQVWRGAAQAARLFPFFGNLSDESERLPLLHYIADFVIGTEP